jgi:multidrug efflux pump subunit AcrA (membrane-fusion protein)
VVSGRQIVEVRVAHVRDLNEILVRAGDQVEVSQVLARLSGYAAELSWDVRLSEEQLAEARVKLAEAEASLAASRRDAASAHEQAVADAAARVTKLSRQVAALQRQKQIADARLAEARATTDLAYREALAKAEYELHLAELAQQIVELEVADTTAQLEQAQADLEAARANLERLKKSEEEVSSAPPLLRSSAQAVRTNELRLARARARLEETVVKSLVVGQVLDIRVDRVDGNEATVVIRIMPVLSRFAP